MSASADRMTRPDQAAIHAGPATARRVRTALILCAYALVFFGALPALLWALGGAVDAVLGLPSSRGRAWGLLGVGLAVPGATLMLWSMLLLRLDGRGWPVSHLPPTNLVRRGPYAWMRHPIYVGYTVTFAGAAAVSGSPGRALGATAALTGGWILYAVYFEEPRLQKRLGATSRVYRDHTPLFPRRPPQTGAAARPDSAAAGARVAGPAIGAEPLLAARGLRKRYGRRQVFEGVSLGVCAGEVVGIAGENGAGKSTLVRILAGILRPDAGVVRRPTVMGYAPQEPLLYEHLTVWEHFRYVAAARGMVESAWRSRAESLLDLYRFEQWRDEPAARLSGGTRQKLNLTLALLSDPVVLLLDEPYGGFEWETYLRFWENVREMRSRGHGMVIVSHLFHERTHFDRLLELRDGRLEPVT